MSAPPLSPNHATLVGATPPDTIGAGDRVWVRRAGSWRPGIVLQSNASAATVRYRPSETIGTGVDTVTRNSLRPRHDHDPYLDKATVADPDRPAPALATRTSARTGI
ncbi:hypothetical protein [Micromonospora sp. WMMD812]|uniref:hypothetical protein n=1 Tax=Micromonospora sp. WMMD812 TaxID=3015152 RepID=UPI00248D06EC|nr:hypothetical protein [Micromonospora sp. WMMD812]WBB68427.1 hypothetical protein O7603_03335 [Micromonospora sp. WMMD812]